MQITKCALSQKKLNKVNLPIPFLSNPGKNCLKTICFFGLSLKVKVYSPKCFLWKVRGVRGLEQRLS